MSTKKTDKRQENKFLESEKELLNSKFLNFSDTFKLCFSLFKEQILQGFLLPYLLDFAGSSILFIPFMVLLIVFFLSLFNLGNVNSLQSLHEIKEPEQILEIFSTVNFGPIAFVLLIFTLLSLILPAVFSYFIKFKQYDFLLSNKSSYFEGFLKDFDRFFKTILTNILFYIIQLPLFIVYIFSILGFVFSLLLIFANSSQNIQETSIGFIYDILPNLKNSLGSSIWIFIVILLILNILSLVAINFIRGFLGLAELLSIKTELGPTESIKKSFSLSKKYFWKNVLRWFLYGLTITLFSIFVNVFDSTLSFIFQNIPILNVFYSFISFFIIVTFNFIVFSFQTGFYITSFSNFLALEKDSL